MTTRIRCCAVVVLFTLGVAAAGGAQTTTTGSLSGAVVDQQGGVLPGVTVTAVHTPTGTTYDGVTQTDGRFTFVGVRVGGPYSVTATLSGFRDQTKRDLVVALGEEQVVNFKLELATVTETVTVTAETLPLFSPSATGTTGQIGTELIETLPTINRTLTDFARVNPFFSASVTNANSGAALSVAGRPSRYNNIQIDGAVNNDLFGLADSGTPGGQADTQPISIDAIQELQLVVSPYDVRQGGFSGGGVNAITRGGSNAYKGSFFWYNRDQGLVGKGVDNRPIATFGDTQSGGSVGGPIARNRAFFFGNVDIGRRDTPAGYSISGTSGVSFGRQAEAQRFLDILQRRYGYNPGGLDETIRKTSSDKVFGRTDFNLGRSQLTVRHNFVDAFSDVGTQTNFTYKLPDNFYRFNSQTNSTVAQLNSTFKSMFNELRVTAQRIRENRTNPATANRFPQVQIRLPDGTNLVAGTEQFSTANALDQDVFEFTDDLTMVKGKHTLTFGTHNEFFKFRNLFIRDNFGSYQFQGLDNFEAGIAQNYDYSFSLTGNPRQPAEFSIRQLGFYAGDQWRVASHFSLTYGFRFDTPIFPDTPTANPEARAIYGFGTDVVPSSKTWSPRVGFNWDMSRGGPTRQQIRGGVGIFGGRTPYVWLSNQYGNTGIEFRRISVPFNVNNRVTFVPNADNQPTSVGGAFANEIDLVDPDYSYPQLIRGNLAVDRGLPLGLVGTVELLFSSSLKDIDYRNLNLRPTATRQDGRPFYGTGTAQRVSPIYSDVVFLTNTDQGGNWSLATRLERPFRRGWTASGSYLFGRSESVNDGGSSQARSNWINNLSTNINAVPVARSNFNVGHRVTIAATYRFDLKRAGVTASMYYNGQTGRPYTYAFGTDVNGDGSSTNDLLYVPREGEATILNGAYADLLAFLNAGDCEGVSPGSIVVRNACKGPWVNSFDLKAAVDVPIGRVRAEITFDLLNFLNLLDRGNGLVDFATFNSLLVATSTTTGAYTYNLNALARPNTTTARYTRDDLRSRWQGQIGLRLKF